MTTRDRNRPVFQGDTVSALALGIHKFLCLTGE
jgi:5,10-methylenetetrahydrofolate reductase